MHPLNPFLRAFFRSALPAQCTPAQQHVSGLVALAPLLTPELLHLKPADWSGLQILLVPTTEVLLTSRDRESGSLYADLAYHEDFLESHVLRLRNGSAVGSGKDGANVRDNRGKAMQFTTVNGRTVVVKDAFVYSNKGFKTLNQAQLLNDSVYYPDSLDAQQWLIYYISRPLVGSFETVNIVAAAMPKRTSGAKPPSAQGSSDTEGPSAVPPRKKEIKSFNDLLNNFPMIARQMQPGLARLFKDFGKDFEKPLPTPPSRSSSTCSRRKESSQLSRADSHDPLSHKMSNGHANPPLTAGSHADDEQDVMRRALESAVTAAVDLFQLVDKQQLSLLGATTDLTGPLVERLIERYVTEQVHDSTLFPRICRSTRLDDLEVESRIRQMENVDISQVGIAIEGGRQGKEELMQRLGRGVEEFRKLGVAGSPQEMMEILLTTAKTVTSAASTNPNKEWPPVGSKWGVTSEKQSPIMTINADTLVSLLLVVVIRSQVRHLQARLFYMRHFIFIDDVEGGEMGYVLSTFEAVLSYLAKDSGGLRKASRRNKRLWQATKNGDIQEMKAVLEPENEKVIGDDFVQDTEQIDGVFVEEPDIYNAEEEDHVLSMNGSVHHQYPPTATTTDSRSTSEESTLAHVFPFQTRSSPPPLQAPPRKDKRVSMDMRSLSSSSGYSVKSRTTTIDSRGSGVEGDTSIDKLSKTQDSSGDSVLMMAVEARQPDALKYLLTLNAFYPIQAILDDSNSEGTTLLSAAVQLAHTELIEIILDFVFRAKEDRVIIDYFAKQDAMGRTVAHYLFNVPKLISKIGRMLPWRRKDRNGQTPLFALCRSYDHPHYSDMVNGALAVATQTQGDGQALHLDDHVDTKGNTLLHVVNDSQLTLWILQHCDSDANATNDKRFTPLMVSSKYGRIDMVRALFGDPRVDLYAKEHRGMTAVELAKDDEVRNRIDDLILFSNPPGADGRITTVVRSFFVEDATIRLILKSGAPNANSTITVTTCRRSLSDFENLAKWLAVEHPASWLPSIFNFRSPFQISTRPARAVLHDIQVRLDSFLKIMLSHSTFSTHEMLWEFFLVPEVQPEMMAERSKKKAEIRAEKVKEEYEPVDDVRDVELFVSHAREMVRGVNHLTKSVIRRVNRFRNTSSDLSDAQHLSSRAFSTLTFLPESHITAFTRYSTTLHPFASDPYRFFFSDMHAISSTVLAILSALARPHSLIASMSATSKAIDRHTSSLRRSDRWPLGLLDDTRNKIHLEAAEKVEKSQEELRGLGSELRYTQQTVAGELAGWQDLHDRMGRRAIRMLVQRMVVREKDRLAGMKRAVRGVLDLTGKNSSHQGS